MTAQTIDALHERREQLHEQLKALRSQHAYISRDVQLAEARLRAALAEGQDSNLLAERCRQRETGLQQTSWAIEKIRKRVAETEAEIRRRASHTALDQDLMQFLADLQSYDECRAQLDGAHQAAIDKIANIAKEVHELVWTARQRHDELDKRAQALRATAGLLDRPDVTVPAPRSWSRPIEQALRDTGAPWRAYLTSVQNRAPEPFARELGVAAAAALVVRRQATR
jgi:chromosome segregation ATPase